MVKRKLQVKKTVLRSLNNTEMTAVNGGARSFSSSESQLTHHCWIGPQPTVGCPVDCGSVGCAPAQ